MMTFRSQFSNLLSLAAVVSSTCAITLFASGAAVQESEDAPVLNPVDGLRGVEVPVRMADASANADDPPTTFVDTYMDWDFGKMIYRTEGGLAVTTPPRNWEMRSASVPGGGLVTLCFQPSSGLSFVLDGEELTWEAVEEPSTDLVVGDFDVDVAVEDGNVFAVRFDRFSGRSWVLEEEGWKPVAGNLVDWPEEN